MSDTQTKLLSATPATNTIGTGECLAKVDAQGKVTRISFDHLPLVGVKRGKNAGAIAGYPALVVAFSESDKSKYIIYVGLPTGQQVNTIVLANNGLTVSATNGLGTVALNGPDDIIQYAIQFTL